MMMDRSEIRREAAEREDPRASSPNTRTPNGSAVCTFPKARCGEFVRIFGHDGFLAQDVLSRLGRLDGPLAVKTVGKRDVDCVNVVRFKQRLVASVGVWSKYSNAQRVSSLHLPKGPRW